MTEQRVYTRGLDKDFPSREVVEAAVMAAGYDVNKAAPYIDHFLKYFEGGDDPIGQFIDDLGCWIVHSTRKTLPDQMEDCPNCLSGMDIGIEDLSKCVVCKGTQKVKKA